MPDPKFTPAGGASFHYDVQPDGQDGFSMTWWLKAMDGGELQALSEPAASEQEAQEQACVVAERHGFANLFRASSR